MKLYFSPISAGATRQGWLAEFPPARARMGRSRPNLRHISNLINDQRNVSDEALLFPDLGGRYQARLAGSVPAGTSDDGKEPAEPAPYQQLNQRSKERQR